MNDHGTQDSLFKDPVGVRLRLARERAGISLEQAGQQLKLPVAVVDAMEREDWSRLGAPIYVRSYLGSYLRLLGLPQDLLVQVSTPSAPPALVPHSTRSRLRRTLEHSLRNAVYLVMTAALIVPVVLVTRYYQSRDRVPELTLEPAAATSPAEAPRLAGAPADTATAPAPAVLGPPPPAAAPVVEAGPDPVMASLSPFQGGAAVANELVLRFSGESWVDVVAADGQRVERGLVAAGGERRYAPGQVARITLGNADAVQVSVAGRAVDMTPYRAANVARFAVSSDGQPAPAGH